MAVTDQIIVELIADTSQLDPAIATLEKTGAIDAKMANQFKQTTAEINKQVQAVRTLNVPFAPLKKNLDDVAKGFKNTSAFVEGFAESMMAELQKAGVTMDEFIAALTKGPKEAEAGVESLRGRLKNLTQAIAEQKLAGNQDTDAFRQMVIEAGNLRNAMDSASKEVRTFSSDSRTFDVIAGSVSTLASGFAVAQGTMALFGDDGEELQKTLLKVNSAMAIAQGLQQITNALTKEGAINQARVLLLQKISNAQLILENAQQSTSIIVRTAAAGAQRLLNAAMAANPIGILAVALAGLITLLATYGASAAAARQQTSTLNVELSTGAENFKQREQAIADIGKNTIENLQNQGVVQSKVTQAELENLDLLTNARKEKIADLRALEKNTTDGDIKEQQRLNDEIRRLENQKTTDAINRNHIISKIQKQQIEEALKNRVASIEADLALAREGSQRQLALQKILVDAQKDLALNAEGLLDEQRRELENKAQQQRLELETQFQQRRLQLQIKGIETQLINVEQGSKEEFILRTRLIALQAQAEITSTKLSQPEKDAVIKQGLANQAKLKKDFNEADRRTAIEDEIARNKAVIDNIKTSNEDKLLLQEVNINLAAQLEIDAALGNAAKIKEIIARREADIIQIKKTALEAALEFELGLLASREGANLRSLERIASDEKQKARIRIVAINEIAFAEITNIDKRLALLQEEKDKKFITEQDYQAQYAKLQDQKLKVTENAEHGVTDIVIGENKKRKELIFQIIEITIDTFRQIGDILGQISQQRAERDQQRVDGEKARIQELLEAGAITEKEANARNKRIEVEEKRLKREAAQRDKNLAIFNAIINTAQAITKALASSAPPLNIILAGIAAALGAIQIGVISNRPIPKFRYGKKNQYTGPGEIAEAGPEILERDRQMYVVDRPRIVWLGRTDKVYNPAETREILGNTPRVDASVRMYRESQQERHDYKKIGEAVAKEISKLPGVNINVDENGFHVGIKKGQEFIHYMDKRYSSKT